jgi:hypothetical protein
MRYRWFALHLFIRPSVSFASALLIHAQHPIEDLQHSTIQVAQRVLPFPLDLALPAPPLKRLQTRFLALPISLGPFRTLTATRTHTILHRARLLLAGLALRLSLTHRFHSAQVRRVLFFESNERGGNLVRGGVQITRDGAGVGAGGAVAQEGEVHRDVEGGLCRDAGCDEVRAESGVHAQRAEEEGFFGGGPVARWWVEGRGVWRLWRLGSAGEMVTRGGDVGREVLDDVDVAVGEAASQG